MHRSLSTTCVCWDDPICWCWLDSICTLPTRYQPFFTLSALLLPTTCLQQMLIIQWPWLLVRVWCLSLEVLSTPNLLQCIVLASLPTNLHFHFKLFSLENISFPSAWLDFLNSAVSVSRYSRDECSFNTSYISASHIWCTTADSCCGSKNIWELSLEQFNYQQIYRENGRFWPPTLPHSLPCQLLTYITPRQVTSVQITLVWFTVPATMSVSAIRTFLCIGCL